MNSRGSTLGDITKSSGTTIKPLSLTSGTQHPIASATNVLATLLHQHCGHSIDFIVGSYGAGGQSIAQLMSTARQSQIKRDEGYTYDCVSSNKSGFLKVDNFDTNPKLR